MIHVPKKYLEIFFHLAKGTEGVLSLKEARIRDHFLKSFIPIVQTFEEDRKKIFEKFCTKTEDGSPDVADGQYKFDKGVQKELTEELELLHEEAVEISVLTPEILKDILERSEYKPKVGEAEVIDEILAKL